ncbi:MAG: CDP-alcohol phosphatidyltransferase family protein [Patescibacteria group bacterium]|nr:CDP-alcohol phosphatidyltransferase family protein [Patescibacteria group bacterium]
MSIISSFMDEITTLLNLVQTNDMLHLEVIISLVNVSVILLLTFIGLRFNKIKECFLPHIYEKEPKTFYDNWKTFLSAPLLSANGICMWRIYLSIPLAIMATIFYYDPIISFIIFQVYVFLFVTDALDGAVARALDNVTGIGKILDPLADKVLDLIILAIVCFYSSNIFFITLASLIIVLDITGQMIRGKSKNPAASWIGKTKTVIKVITIYIISLNRYEVNIDYIGGILLSLTLIFTFWSFYGKLSDRMKSRSIEFLVRFIRRKVS